MDTSGVEVHTKNKDIFMSYKDVADTLNTVGWVVFRPTADLSGIFEEIWREYNGRRDKNGLLPPEASLEAIHGDAVLNKDLKGVFRHLKFGKALLTPPFLVASRAYSNSTSEYLNNTATPGSEGLFQCDVIWLSGGHEFGWKFRIIDEDIDATGYTMLVKQRAICLSSPSYTTPTREPAEGWIAIWSYILFTDTSSILSVSKMTDILIDKAVKEGARVREAVESVGSGGNQNAQWTLL